MPHHTDKGWNQHISHTMREDIENVRKRAIIAQRKEEYHRRQDADEPPVKRAKVVEIPMAEADPELVTEDDEEHDLNMIAHYFANNNSDAEQSDGEEQSDKDARSWARLTAQVNMPCLTVCDPLTPRPFRRLAELSRAGRSSTTPITRGLCNFMRCSLEHRMRVLSRISFTYHTIFARYNSAFIIVSQPLQQPSI
jgi:hypothetical protein